MYACILDVSQNKGAQERATLLSEIYEAFHLYRCKPHFTSANQPSETTKIKRMQWSEKYGKTLQFGDSHPEKTTIPVLSRRFLSWSNSSRYPQNIPGKMLGLVIQVIPNAKSHCIMIVGPNL